MRNAPNGFRFRRISGSLGAEVSGVDLSGGVDDRTIDAIRAGLLEHLVLVFRDQSLDPASLAAFARRFGELKGPAGARAIPSPCGFSTPIAAPRYAPARPRAKAPRRPSPKV